MSIGSRTRENFHEAQNLALVIFLILVACPTASCSPTRIANTKGGKLMQVFTSGDKTIVIDEPQLEAIRKAVVEKLATKDDDIYRSLKQELERSIAVIGPGPDDTRLGAWVLTTRDDQLALIRVPPRGPVNYIFVAKLARDKGRWVVTDFLDERMMAR